jgi:hypothetical protein
LLKTFPEGARFDDPAAEPAGAGMIVAASLAAVIAEKPVAGRVIARAVMD